MSASLLSSVSSCDDIDVLPAPDDVEAFEFQASIGGALAGFQVVFIAVPRADEMDVRLREFLPDPSAVRSEHILDLVHDDAFAGRPTLMHAEVLIGVELALPVEHANLAPLMADDAAFAVGELLGLGDKDFRHAIRPLVQRKSMAPIRGPRQRSRVRGNWTQGCAQTHCRAAADRYVSASEKRPGAWTHLQFLPQRLARLLSPASSRASSALACRPCRSVCSVC